MNYPLTVKLIALSSVVLLAFTFLRLPGNSLFWNSLQNSGHGIVFGILSVVVLIALQPLVRKQLLKVSIISGVSLFLLGASIELAQYVTGRGARTDDLVMNSVGILGGICLHGAAYGLRQRNTMTARSLALSLSGIAAVVWILHWPVIYLLSGLQRPSLPTLADFENSGARHYLSGNGSTFDIAVFEQWFNNPSNSVQVQFESGRWSNFAFLEPERDWSNYSRITFSGYNPQDTEVVLNIRVDDKDLGHYDNDHMTVHQAIAPGTFSVTIGFDAFRNDAILHRRPGKAAFERINGFMIFVSGAKDTLVMYFDDVTLE